MCLLVGLLSEYYCWNRWPRQLKSHIPQPRSFTYEDSLSDQAAAAAAAAAFSFCLTQLSAYHITKQTSLATTMKGGLGGFTQAYWFVSAFVINCEIFFLLPFSPSSHLHYLIFYTSSFLIHLSYFWSTSSSLPFLPLLASILVFSCVHLSIRSSSHHLPPHLPSSCSLPEPGLTACLLSRTTALTHIHEMMQLRVPLRLNLSC